MFCGLEMDKNQRKVLDLLNEKGIYAKLRGDLEQLKFSLRAVENTKSYE